MPAFRDFLTEGQIQQLIAYLRAEIALLHYPPQNKNNQDRSRAWVLACTPNNHR